MSSRLSPTARSNNSKGVISYPRPAMVVLYSTGKFRQRDKLLKLAIFSSTCLIETRHTTCGPPILLEMMLGEHSKFSRTQLKIHS